MIPEKTGIPSLFYFLNPSLFVAILGIFKNQSLKIGDIDSMISSRKKAGLKTENFKSFNAIVWGYF